MTRAPTSPILSSIGLRPGAVTRKSGVRPKPCAHPWRLKITSSSRCPMPARPSGIWRTRPGSSRRSFWLPCSPASSQLIRQYSYLFNSYYNAVGERIARDRRGVLSRPTVAEVFRYRAAVDKRMKEFLDRAGNTAFERVRSTLDPGVAPRATAPGADPHRHQARAGEQSQLARRIARRRTETTVAHAGPAAPGWIPFAGGLRSIGHESAGFAFDNEGPRHQRVRRRVRAGRSAGDQPRISGIHG